MSHFLSWVRPLTWATLLLSVLSCSAELTSQRRTTTTQRSSSSTVPRIPSGNTLPLRKRLGKEAIVYGRIVRTGKSSSGHHFLNFQSKDFSIACLKGDVKKFPKGGPAEIFKNQEIEIRGKIEEFKGRLQIQLKDPKQIRIATKKSATNKGTVSGLPAAIKLKKIGTDTWLSPAGLRYRGRDPKGLTRVEHVLRHARDLPQRDGPHGVFNGGDGVALALVDEAWRQVKKTKTRPKVEGGRESYTISMGRTIGYLGGKTGARRKKPALRSIFIVVRKGSSDVITAFPR